MKTFLAIIFAFISCIAFAQKINSVTFQEKGDYKFGGDVLRLYIQSRRGSQFDERVVNDDIKRLHATGFFSDVSSETKRRPDNTVDLIFRVVPQVIVTKIRFSGNKYYDNAKLRSKITISENSPLNYKRIYESATAIRNFYETGGHAETTVTPRIRRKKDGKVDVEFVIKEKLNLKIGKVIFKGARVYNESDLSGSITNQHSWFSWVPLLELGRLNKKEIQNDIVRLRDKYWEDGYLDFRVKDVQIQPVKDEPEFVDLIFLVEEGKPYKVGSVRIENNKRFTVKELMPFVRLKKGEVFRTSREARTISGIESKYSPMGYCDFRGTVEKIPDFQTHTVDLVIHIDEGEPFKVRDVFISGNKWTKDHVIRRELAIAPGDPVDKQRISASKSRLMGMGYFKKVDAVSHTSPEQGKKDIDIVVDEKNFLNAKMGGGFSDTDGLAGMIELSHTNMDILDPKNYFTGGGQRMRVLALIGTERFNIEANFTEPWLFGKKLRWDLSGYFRDAAYEDWNERRIGVTTSLTKRIFDDFTSVSGGYTFENVRVHNMNSDMVEMEQFTGSDFVGRVHLSLDRDTRDNSLMPTSGYNVNLYGAVSSQIFGGTENYYRLEAKAINHYSFFDKMFILTTGAKVGYIGTMGNTDEVPLYERYFMGGGDSIRGFPYRSVGPTTPIREDNYGGDFMYLATVEVSHPIYKFIRGAVFTDIGNSVEAGSDMFQAPNIGVGYGLRLKIPGVNAPIRLDLAVPVLNKQDGVSTTVRFHFNMGFALF